MNKQEVFDFPQVEQLNWSDFVESDENRNVLQYLKQWQSWTTNSLIIYGAPGVGKTHVVSLWAQSANAACVRPDNMHQVRKLFETDVNFLMDDFEEFLQPQNYQWLFDFMNILNEKHRYLIIISRDSPSSWNISLPDLRSRLLLVPALKIQSPSDGLLFHIAKKIAKDNGITISDECVKYILNNVTRDVHTVRNTIYTLNKLSLEQKQSVTLPFVRRHIAGLR